MKNKYSLEYFFQKPWSFILIKNGEIIFKSKAQHLKPLVLCIKKYKREMRGTIVFDKVVGQAAAILLTYARVKEVWTPVVSRGAKRILAKNKIKLVCQKEAENIMNRSGNDLCLMEKKSRNMPEKEFIEKILR